MNPSVNQTKPHRPTKLSHFDWQKGKKAVRELKKVEEKESGKEKVVVSCD